MNWNKTFELSAVILSITISLGLIEGLLQIATNHPEPLLPRIVTTIMGAIIAGTTILILVAIVFKKD